MRRERAVEHHRLGGLADGTAGHACVGEGQAEQVIPQHHAAARGYADARRSSLEALVHGAADAGGQAHFHPLVAAHGHGDQADAALGGGAQHVEGVGAQVVQRGDVVLAGREAAQRAAGQAACAGGDNHRAAQGQAAREHGVVEGRHRAIGAGGKARTAAAGAALEHRGRAVDARLDQLCLQAARAARQAHQRAVDQGQGDGAAEEAAVSVQQGRGFAVQHRVDAAVDGQVALGGGRQLRG